jgi:dienelactone hydrolase
VQWRGSECVADPDYKATATHARETLVAAYEWALGQPWVRKDRILFEGQSVGGLATVAVSALNLPGVVGTVNFAGGSGGFPDGSPGKSCWPAKLTDLYGEFGREAKAPSLWLYAPNDLYWGAEVPPQWHAAYKAGGSDTLFVQTAPVEGADGHHLLNVGGRMWSGPLNAFMKKVGLTAP